MIAVKGVFDGKKIELLEPLPKKHAQKRSMVIVTFLEEEKVPPSTQRALQELVQGKLLDFDEVVSAI